MKQRILVMNGQRLVQSEQGKQWTTDKVEKAKTVKPGIYNIYLSTQADKSKAHDGVIVHVDKDHVYQQIGKNFVKHDRVDFDNIPDIGANTTVKYDVGKAVVSGSLIKSGRTMA